MSLSVQIIAPPLVGAAIGYMTNYVAIKMLFRPLKPWRIGGYRLPLTPGVIPAKRLELADNIGEMVGEHLLPSADINRAINSARFQNELQSLVNNRITAIISRDLGPLSSIIPEEFLSYFLASVRIIRLRVIKHLHHYLNSHDFHKMIETAIHDNLTPLLAKDLNQLITPKKGKQLEVFSNITANHLLTSPQAHEWLTAIIKQELAKALTENKSPADILPANIIKLIPDLVEKAAPDLLKQLAGLIEVPEIRAKIIKGINNSINEFIDSLGPVGAMARGFLTPETIGSKISELLDNKGDDISKWLADDEIRNNLAGVLRHQTEKLLHTPCLKILGNPDKTKIDDYLNEISANLTIMATRPETITAVSNMLAQGLSGVFKQPVGKAAASIFGADAEKQGIKWLTEETIKLFRQPQTKHVINRLLIELVEQKLLCRPIGPIKNLLPRRIRESTGTYLLEQINLLLAREVPDLIDTFNIRRIVTRKVNSLDILHLEKLLLTIMQEQFKYINLFGAFLGFLIGLLNLIFII